MVLLLDTHTLLWARGDPGRIGKAAAAAMAARDARRFVSVASLWEIAIKVGVGKLSLPDDYPTFVRRGLSELKARRVPVKSAHLDRFVGLPLHHREPFDRMLVAQALAEQTPVVSADAALDPFGVVRIWD